MTHVADDVMLGKFVRRIKGLVERAIAGSLDIEKLEITAVALGWSSTRTP